MKERVYLLSYLKDGEECIEEVYAYTYEQAFFLATQICSEDDIINLELTVKMACC